MDKKPLNAPQKHKKAVGLLRNFRDSAILPFRSTSYRIPQRRPLIMVKWNLTFRTIPCQRHFMDLIRTIAIAHYLLRPRQSLNAPHHSWQLFHTSDTSFCETLNRR